MTTGSCALPSSVTVSANACVQIPATQPLLILATCQKPPEELPPALLNFFQPHSPPPTSASRGPSQQSDDHRLSDSNHSLNAIGTTHAESSQVIVVESEAEAASAGRWQEAVSRSAEAAAHAVAAAAALSLEQKLLELSSATSSQQVLHGSSLDAQNPVRSQIRPGQFLNGPDAEADGADRKVMCDNGPLSQYGVKPPVPTRSKETASRGAKAVNENELHHGLQLHAEVGIAVVHKLAAGNRESKCVMVYNWLDLYLYAVGRIHTHKTGLQVN